MLQRIDFAARQALDARQKAAECTDAGIREEWLRAAGMWDELLKQYRMLQNMNGQRKPG